MAYSDLSLKERARVIHEGVNAGLKSLKDIQSFYDSKVSSSVDYDLEGYYKEHPEHIFNHEGHYPDTYKKPNHPTFSDESIYHSEDTPGGHWSRENGRDVYEPSDYVLNQQGGWNNFLQRFQGQEQGTGAVPVFRGGAMLPEVEVHPHGEGGSIHIAPSKRGTFTAAATKHGKSVQAFASQVLANKENYSPAMVKKANFARNAAHWHDDGGSTKVTKVTAISPSGTWQGYRFPEGSHYATVTEGEYFGLLNDARNMGMNSYDALRYADENVEYNAGLLPEVTVPGTRGLITKSGNSLINQGVIRDANRQRARESGALIYDPNESQRALAIQRELDRRGNEKLKEDASRGFNALLGMAAPSTYYNLAHLDNQLSPGQAFAADLGVGLLTGAGAAALKTASKKMPGIIRRGIEGAMRQGPGPIPNIPEYANLLLHDKDARNYVLKGVIGGRDPKQMFGPYQGLMGAAYESVEGIPYNRDYISAVLYGTPLDERIAQRVGIGEGFGPALEGYINTAYPNKKSNIPVYQLETPHTSTSKVPNELVSAIEDIHPTPYIHSMPMNDAFVTNGLDNVTINAGGYSNNMGTLNGRQVMQGTDIWKFNPDDYSAKWLNKYQTTQTEKQLPFWKKLLYKQGLKVVDDYTTPIVTKTAWGYMPTLRSTGGSLYPFSFGKRGLPAVRFDDGGDTQAPVYNPGYYIPDLDMNTLHEAKWKDDLINQVRQGLDYGYDYYNSPGFRQRATAANEKFETELYDVEHPFGEGKQPSAVYVYPIKPHGYTEFSPVYNILHNAYLWPSDFKPKNGTVGASIMAHEVAHNVPLFNNMRYDEKGNVYKTTGSPLYGKDYTRIPKEWKRLLRHDDPKTWHDKELNESYSDLMQLRYLLNDAGIFDSRQADAEFTEEMLNQFKKTKQAKSARFLQNHKDNKKVIRAINEIAQNSVGNTTANTEIV